MIFLYIDPGTGSMLLSLFIGIATACIFGLRALFVKLQFIVTGGKIDKKSDEKTSSFVIFSDHKRYGNVFKAICDEFEKRGINLIFYTASPDDPLLLQDYKFVKTEFLGEKNKPYSKLNFLKADIVISTTPGLEVYQWKRSKDVKYYVHIPHTVDDLSGYRMFGLDYYDAVLTSGSNQINLIRKLESLRPNIQKKEIYSVGSLTLDNLKTRFDNSNRIKNERKVILIAPSWGPSGILTKYGERFLKILRNLDYKIIIRPHPQTVVSEKAMLQPLQEKFSDFEWNYDNDNFEVLNKADLLITDFSGIIFDYSLVFDKPLIYADTNFDTLPYDADWIDDKMWSLKAVERLGVQLKEEELNNIGNIINSVLNDDKYKYAREEIRKECWLHIGDSAKITVDWLIEKKKDLDRVL